MSVYLSTGIGPVRVSKRVGGRRRPKGSATSGILALIMLAPATAMLMTWWLLVPTAAALGLVLTAFAVVTSPFAGRGRRFSWATHVFTLVPRYWRLIVKVCRWTGVA